MKNKTLNHMHKSIFIALSTISLISFSFPANAGLGSMAIGAGVGAGVNHLIHKGAEGAGNIAHNANTAVAQPSICQNHNQWGLPNLMRADGQEVFKRSVLICRDNYITYYDTKTKTPLWVAEIVGPRGEKEPRTENFAPDPQLNTALQAGLADFKGSGFDRGHMAPAADMTSAKAMEQSFYLTNMVPQVGPNMNRGIWAELESMVRNIADKEGATIVFTGPIYKGNVQTMGPGQVWIPTHLYKVVYRPSKGVIVSYVMHNSQIITNKSRGFDAGNPQYPQTTAAHSMKCNNGCEVEDFRVDLKEVERLTGLKFFPVILK